MIAALAKVAANVVDKRPKLDDAPRRSRRITLHPQICKMNNPRSGWLARCATVGWLRPRCTAFTVAQDVNGGVGWGPRDER